MADDSSQERERLLRQIKHLEKLRREMEKMIEETQEAIDRTNEKLREPQTPS